MGFEYLWRGFEYPSITVNRVWISPNRVWVSPIRVWVCLRSDSVAFESGLNTWRGFEFYSQNVRVILLYITSPRTVSSQMTKRRSMMRSELFPPTDVQFNPFHRFGCKKVKRFISYFFVPDLFFQLTTRSNVLCWPVLCLWETSRFGVA